MLPVIGIGTLAVFEQVLLFVQLIREQFAGVGVGQINGAGANRLDFRQDGFDFFIFVPKRILDEKTQSAVGRAELRFGPGIEFVTVRLTPLQSLETAFDKVVGLTRFQAAAVGGMAKGEVSTENLSGPVGIAGMAGSALTAGVSAFLEFVALISIAIGFMNLIPIPALDGGQLVILGIEGLMGRSLARGLKEKLGAVSMALLLLLAVYVTMNDIGRLGG